MWKEESEEINLKKIRNDADGKESKDAIDALEFDWRDGDEVNKPQFVGLSKEELKQYENDPFWKRVRLILFILFWLIWAAFLVAAALLLAFTPKCPKTVKLQWWQRGVGYSIETKSFFDRNGDGIGDLKGIIDKLDYIKENGFNFIVLTDTVFANDSLTDISPVVGTMADFNSLVSSAWKKGIHVVVDIPWKQFLFERKTDGNSTTQGRNYLLSSINKLVDITQVDGVNFYFDNSVKNFSIALDFFNETRKLLDKVGSNRLRPKLLMITALKNFTKELSVSEYNQLQKAAGVFVSPYFLDLTDLSSSRDVQSYLQESSNSTTLPSNIGWQVDNLYSKRFSARNLSFHEAFPLLFLSTGTPIFTYGSEVLMRGHSENSTYDSRSPMMWNTDKHAGFTNSTPWLPVESNYKTQNVLYFNAHGVPNSPAPIIRLLMQLRTNHSLLYGRIHAYSYDGVVYWTAEEIGHPGYLMILNLKGDTHFLLNHTMFGLKSSKMKVVFDSYQPSALPYEISTVNLFLRKKSCTVLQWPPKRVK